MVTQIILKVDDSKIPLAENDFVNESLKPAVNFSAKTASPRRQTDESH